MSGRGHSGQQPGNGPLGNKIKEELLSALRLLFKTAEQHAVDLALRCQLTVFVTELPCAGETVMVHPPEPKTSENVIRAIQEQVVVSNNMALIESVCLAEEAPCAWNSVLCSEPVFDEMRFDPVDVDFENMSHAKASTWPVHSIVVPFKSKAIGKMPAPKVSDVQAEPMTTKSRSLADASPKVSVKNDPRLYTLPIRKAAIPPHRFSPDLRQKFRMALAEKADTHENNVQLKMIFERMDMGLFSAIQMDDSGNLMCTPKGELLGRNSSLPAAQSILRQVSAGSGASYLVVGVRLDNKTDIRALVPVESVINSFSEDEAGA